MSVTWKLLVTIAASLAIIAAAVASGDRGTFVPPPDAVAENFGRYIAERRFEHAGRTLSSGLARSQDGKTLSARYRPALDRIGQVNSIRAVVDWQDADSAAASATIDADRGQAIVPLRFVREHGLWKISELPVELAVAVTSRAP